jgi:hypothetical protein
MRKKAKNRLLARAAQNSARVLSVPYRAATALALWRARERSSAGHFRSLPDQTAEKHLETTRPPMNADKRRLETSKLSAFISVHRRPICFFQWPAKGSTSVPPPEKFPASFQESIVTVE